MYLMDDQSGRGTRSNVIHIDYNSFRLSYTFKYMSVSITTLCHLYIFTIIVVRVGLGVHWVFKDTSTTVPYSPSQTKKL